VSVVARKVLIDECLPHDLRLLLPEHHAYTVAYMGWAGTKNGELLAACERESFDILITSDQGFPHQQNMEGRKLAILLLPTPDWNIIKHHASTIFSAIETSLPGTFVRVAFSSRQLAWKPGAPEPS
jgi:hypothetical protein